MTHAIISCLFFMSLDLYNFCWNFYSKFSERKREKKHTFHPAHLILSLASIEPPGQSSLCLAPVCTSPAFAGYSISAFSRWMGETGRLFKGHENATDPLLLDIQGASSRECCRSLLLVTTGPAGSEQTHTDLRNPFPTCHKGLVTHLRQDSCVPPAIAFKL